MCATSRRLCCRCEKETSVSACSCGYQRALLSQLDVGQLRLVFDALHERLHMLRAAPHLTNALPTIMPCYRLYEARLLAARPPPALDPR